MRQRATLGAVFRLLCIGQEAAAGDNHVEIGGLQDVLHPGGAVDG